MVEDTSAHAIGKVGGVATYLLINLADMGLSLVLDGRHDEVCWVRVAICRCKSSRLMLIVGAVDVWSMQVFCVVEEGRGCDKTTSSFVILALTR